MPPACTATAESGAKKHSFNCNASFQPRQLHHAPAVLTMPELNAPLQTPSPHLCSPSVHPPQFNSLRALPPKSIPTRGIPLQSPPSKPPSLTSPPVEELRATQEEHCGCPTRTIEISASDRFALEHFVGLARTLYDVESEHALPNCTTRVSFFDNRCPERFKIILLDYFVLRGHDLVVTAIHENTLTAITVEIPWPGKVAQAEIANWMASIGDICRIKFDSSSYGTVSRVLCLYHDIRAIGAALKRPLSTTGMSIKPQVAVTSHSLWASTELHQMRKILFVDEYRATQKQGIVSRIQKTALFPNHVASTQCPSYHRNANFVNTGQRDTEGSGNEANSGSAPNGGWPNNACKMPLARNAYSHSRSTGGRETSDSLLRDDSADCYSLPYNGISPSSDSITVDTCKSLGSVSSIESGSKEVPSIPLASKQSLIGLFKKFTIGDDNCAPSKSSLPRSALSSQSPAHFQQEGNTEASKAAHFTGIDLEQIEAGIETRKTIMVRNIPNKLSFDEFKAFIDQTSENCYEFLYLRFDFCNQCNVGYGFVSFVRSNDLKLFVQKRRGMRWSEHNFNSEKVIDIRFAVVQGRDKLIEKFRKSPVMTQHPEFRPRFYFTSGVLAGKECALTAEGLVKLSE